MINMIKIKYGNMTHKKHVIKYHPLDNMKEV